MNTPTLDEKLKEIPIRTAITNNRGEYIMTDRHLTDEEIAAIHAAYKEAGYSTFRDRDGVHFMTGRMFYDRFEKATNADFEKFINGDDSSPLMKQALERLHKAYLEAACLASGIEEES